MKLIDFRRFKTDSVVKETLAIETFKPCLSGYNAKKKKRIMSLFQSSLHFEMFARESPPCFLVQLPLNYRCGSGRFFLSVNPFISVQKEFGRYRNE